MSVEVTHLVPGDLVHLSVGSIVPADLRLLDAADLECDESILTGESVACGEVVRAGRSGAALAELSSCLFMGTVVHEGAADAVVVATGRPLSSDGSRSGSVQRHPQTEFQLGLTRFSGLLAKVGGVLSVTIFVINVALGRPVIDAVLFSLAVAVGITPQLLPAVVSTSLATWLAAPGHEEGAGQASRVHRGLSATSTCCSPTRPAPSPMATSASYVRSARPATMIPDVLTLGLVCNEAERDGGTAVGGNPLDVALWKP